jgi:co-chaperonin GroES (HSP10)
MAAEAGADGVLDDVATDSGELVLVLDRAAPEAFTEEMSPPEVASVEALGIAPVQLLEAGRQLGDGRLDDQVVVVRHQAERMEAPVMLPDDEVQQPEEDAAVVVVAVDRDPSGTARGDVEVAVGEDVAGAACHRLQATRGPRQPKPGASQSHTFVPLDVSLPAGSGDCPRTWPREPSPCWPWLGTLPAVYRLSRVRT